MTLLVLQVILNMLCWQFNEGNVARRGQVACIYTAPCLTMLFLCFLALNTESMIKPWSSLNVRKRLCSCFFYFTEFK